MEDIGLARRLREMIHNEKPSCPPLIPKYQEYIDNNRTRTVHLLEPTIRIISPIKYG